MNLELHPYRPGLFGSEGHRLGLTPLLARGQELGVRVQNIRAGVRPQFASVITSEVVAPLVDGGEAVGCCTGSFPPELSTMMLAVAVMAPPLLLMPPPCPAELFAKSLLVNASLP